jgi:hypothetical protein
MQSFLLVVLGAVQLFMAWDRRTDAKRSRELHEAELKFFEEQLKINERVITNLRRIHGDFSRKARR